jgi:hypothetical protein
LLLPGSQRQRSRYRIHKTKEFLISSGSKSLNKFQLFTGQAAIGPIALDAARKIGAGREAEDLGLQVLTLAVLGILITAPLGASIVMLAGPRLLSCDRAKGQVSKLNENGNGKEHCRGSGSSV